MLAFGYCCREAYEAKHDTSVLDRTRSEVSGALKRLCVRLLTGPRGGAADIDAASAGMIL